MLLIKIRVVIDQENNYFKLTLIYLGVIRVSLTYVIKREQRYIFTLYRLKRKQRIKITSLYEIIQNFKKREVKDSQKLARKKFINYILNNIFIKAKIKVNIGLNNALSTALVCGWVGVSGSILRAVTYNPKHKLTINIQPLFSKMFFSVNVHCIIALSPANIIIGYIIYKKTRR